MKTKIQKILKNYNINNDAIVQDIINLIIKLPKEELIPVKEELISIEETPILIGHLNKVFGYNGFKELGIGTEVFETKDRYFFKMIHLNGNVPVVQKFYKETLSPCINFIKS